MLDCVREQDLTGIDTVLLKSRGGSFDSAMKIGELIAPLGAHMIVKDYCNSSCANFFLPLASSIRVEAKAEVLLHGSIDPVSLKNQIGTEKKEAGRFTINNKPMPLNTVFTEAGCCTARYTQKKAVISMNILMVISGGWTKMIQSDSYKLSPGSLKVVFRIFQ